MAIDDLCLIWSIEHHAWWRPNEIGYTDTIAEAGLYPKQRAHEIVARANIRTFNECVIPLTAMNAPRWGWPNEEGQVS